MQGNGSAAPDSNAQARSGEGIMGDFSQDLVNNR
jgi:hypothetical protein